MTFRRHTNKLPIMFLSFVYLFSDIFFSSSERKFADGFVSVAFRAQHVFILLFFFSFLSGAEFHDQVIHDCSPRDRELTSFHHSISYNIIFINSFVITVSVVESVSRKTFLSRSAFTSVSCFTLSTNSFVFLNSFQSCFFSLWGIFRVQKNISVYAVPSKDKLFSKVLNIFQIYYIGGILSANNFD